MPDRYLLNSAVITAPGTYVYELVSWDRARSWSDEGPWISTIGYAATAEILTEILGRRVPVDRTPCTMRPGDSALVCRFDPAFRPDPSVKSGAVGRAFAEAMFTAGRFELGILERLR